MLYNEIRTFLGQQNFALTATVNQELTILRNYDYGREIFCVIINNSRGRRWGVGPIRSLNERLTHYNGAYNDVLFLVVTDDAERDKDLSQIPQTRLWIADERLHRLFVYENQPEDFYGLRYGIAETVSGRLGTDRRYPGTQTGRFAGSRINTFPFVTAALIAANVVYFIILSVLGPTDDTAYMISMGANYGEYVFQNFEIWRLVTSMFMHFSFSHLAGNMLYLGIAGYNLEEQTGHLKFFIIYMLSGIGASLVSAGYYYINGGNTISAGASGAVYGLIGAVLFMTYRNRGRMRSHQMFLRIGIVMIFLFYSNFTSEDVDVAAHISGFIFGALLSFTLLGGKNERR